MVADLRRDDSDPDPARAGPRRRRDSPPLLPAAHQAAAQFAVLREERAVVRFLVGQQEWLHDAYGFRFLYVSPHAAPGIEFGEPRRECGACPFCVPIARGDAGQTGHHVAPSGFREVGIQLHRLFEVGECLVGPSFVAERHAEVEVGVGGRGIERHRLLVMNA